MTKEWAKKNGLHPIAYISGENGVSAFADYMLRKQILDGIDQKISFGAWQALYRQLALTKPLEGSMIMAGGAVTKEFYQESEWRFIPDGDHIITEERFEAEKSEGNNRMEGAALKFSPEDIKYMFVQEDADIPAIFDHIHAGMSQFPLTDIKILTSRIVSLETLSRDL